MHLKKKPVPIKLLIGAIGALFAVGMLFLAVMVVTDPEDNLVVRDMRFVGGGKERVIAGTLENKTSNRAYTDIDIQIDFYDEAGNKIGDTSTSREVLEAGKVWQFAAPATKEGVVSYEVLVYSPDNVRSRWLGGCATTSC